MNDKEAMLKLIDVVRDLNKSISMLIDNIGIEITTASLIRKVGADISDDLRELTKYYS